MVQPESSSVTLLRPITVVRALSVTVHSPIQKSNWRCIGVLQPGGPEGAPAGGVPCARASLRATNRRAISSVAARRIIVRSSSP
jgi:hypothetical protein